LSKEYVTLRGPLVTWNLDADVIVAGPTGVWVYEVKNWSGEITCERGQWRRVKTCRERSGRLVQEHEVLRSFDSQWAKEASAVQGTLRRLPDPLDVPGAVGGGLVFTHAKVSVHVGGSCAAWVGRPSSCVETLWSSPEMPTFTMEKRLRVPEALLEWSDGLHEQQGEVPWETASSVELTERLYDEAVSRAVSYYSQIGRHGSNLHAPWGSPRWMIAYIGLISIKHVGSEPKTSLCLVVRGLGSFLPRLGESVLRREDICTLRLCPVAC
jgi:hypothetical protein